VSIKYQVLRIVLCLYYSLQRRKVS